MELPLVISEKGGLPKEKHWQRAFLVFGDGEPQGMYIDETSASSAAIRDKFFSHLERIKYPKERIEIYGTGIFWVDTGYGKRIVNAYFAFPHMVFSTKAVQKILSKIFAAPNVEIQVVNPGLTTKINFEKDQ